MIKLQKKLLLSIVIVFSVLLAALFYFLYAEPSGRQVPITAQDNQKRLEKISHLLREADATSNRTVNILFYGQSITEQSWWKLTANAIQAQYPNTKIEFTNKAIGAHTAEKLVKLVDADVLPMHPDLVIFHVYGGHHFYEEIIKKIKTRTNADILIATDHIGAFDDVDEETKPENLSQRNLINQIYNKLHKGSPQANWNAWKNYAFFPALSEKYGVALIDVRSEWKGYLKSNHLNPRDLLLDNVHLNAQGNRLMADIYANFFKRNEVASAKIMTKNRLTSKDETLLLVGRDLTLQNNRLTAECHGQRVQAIVDPSKNVSNIHVTVDQFPPSHFQSAYGFTRVSSYPDSNWPALLRVTHGDAAFSVENWKAKIFPKDDALNQFDFEVYGSVTGFDGRGNSQTDFVSKSKKIKILAEDWNLAFAYSVFKKKLPENFEITWKTELRGRDVVGQHVSTWPIVQDIADGTHKIVFEGEGMQAIAGVRCFNK